MKVKKILPVIDHDIGLAEIKRRLDTIIEAVRMRFEQIERLYDGDISLRDKYEQLSHRLNGLEDMQVCATRKLDPQDTQSPHHFRTSEIDMIDIAHKYHVIGDRQAEALSAAFKRSLAAGSQRVSSALGQRMPDPFPEMR